MHDPDTSKTRLAVELEDMKLRVRDLERDLAAHAETGRARQISVEQLRLVTDNLPFLIGYLDVRADLYAANWRSIGR